MLKKNGFLIDRKGIDMTTSDETPNLIHPTDYRYLVKELVPYLSEKAFLNYKLKVEGAHARAMAKIGLCSDIVAMEIAEKANISYVKLQQVKDMEAIIKHDIKAMVDVLGEKLSDKAKPYRHLGLTSNDVINTAQSLMIRDVTFNVILPDMITLERKLISLARRERDSIQIGRTHGQHAEPTTFGKEIAVYVDRWGRRIEAISNATMQLRGKASGAVGTLASFHLLCDNPDRLERLIMKNLGLKRAFIATQIIPPEALANYFCQVEIAFATLSDFANNMRHLQRSEIGEVFEGFEEKQIGSSTMPQKMSPINWENIVSQYRAVLPHIITVLMNIESEHQRDLRDSAATRYVIAEVLNAFDFSVRLASRVISRMRVEREAMKRNLNLDLGFWMAEPAYLILAIAGHSYAYEFVQNLVKEARAKRKKFTDLLAADEKFQRALARLSSKKRSLIFNAEKYVGKCRHIVNSVTSYWDKKCTKMEHKLSKRC